VNADNEKTSRNNSVTGENDINGMISNVGELGKVVINEANSEPSYR